MVAQEVPPHFSVIFRPAPVVPAKLIAEEVVPPMPMLCLAFVEAGAVAQDVPFHTSMEARGPPAPQRAKASDVVPHPPGPYLAVFKAEVVAQEPAAHTAEVATAALV